MARKRRVEKVEVEMTDFSLPKELVANRKLITVYETFYGTIRKRLTFSDELSTPTDAKKVEMIKEILADMPYINQIAIISCTNYSTYHAASSITGIEVNRLKKSFELGIKILHYPKNIEIAIPGFYNYGIEEDYCTPLRKEMFGDRKYIVTALNKSSIVYKEQLMRHLSLGWYYLWSIPGCGDAARQAILKAIDNWKLEEGKFKIIRKSELK